MKKSELLAKMRASRQELRELIESIPPERREEPGAMGDWTLKDTLVHLNFWGGQLVTLLYQLRNGVTPGTPNLAPNLDVEAQNQRWYALGRERAWEAAWADFVGIAQQAERRVEEFSEAELNNPNLHPKLRRKPLWEWVAQDTYGHDEEHLKMLRAWLDRPSQS